MSTLRGQKTKWYIVSSILTKNMDISMNKCKYEWLRLLLLLLKARKNLLVPGNRGDFLGRNQRAPWESSACPSPTHIQRSSNVCLQSLQKSMEKQAKCCLHVGTREQICDLKWQLQNKHRFNLKIQTSHNIMKTKLHLATVKKATQFTEISSNV